VSGASHHLKNKKALAMKGGFHGHEEGVSMGMKGGFHGHERGVHLQLLRLACQAALGQRPLARRRRVSGRSPVHPGPTPG